MSLLVPILRPDQGYHVIYAVKSALEIYKSGTDVIFLFCTDVHSYCPVHIYSSDLCGTCSLSIKILLSIISEYISKNSLPKPTIIFSSDIVSKSPNYSQLASEFTEAFQIKQIPRYIANESSNNKLNRNLFHPSFSESFSNEGLTFADLKLGKAKAFSTDSCKKLISRIDRNFMIVKRAALQFNFLFSNYNITSCLLYNGRFAAHKTFLMLLRESSIPTIIHEVGLLDDTISLNLDHSLEEEIVMKHLKLRPKHLSYPNSLKFFGLTKSKYFTPKLSGSATAHSYYQSNPIDHSRAQGDTDIIIFLSSPDELSGAYPFDFTELERDFVSKLISNYPELRIVVRFHPRSHRSLKASKLVEGTYYRFFDSLVQISRKNKSRLTVIDPSSSASSYSLLAHPFSLAVCLFNSMAAELPILGKISVAHSLSRLAPFASHVLNSYNVDDLVEEASSLLKNLGAKRDMPQPFLDYVANYSIPLSEDSSKLVSSILN